MSEEEDEPEGANIIHLPIEFDRTRYEAGQSFLDREPGTCMHLGVRIDTATRTVTCRVCESELDPLDCLVHLAQARRGDESWRKHHERESRDAAKRIEELKKEEAAARKRFREAVSEDLVEQFKVATLDRIAKGVDRVLDEKPEPVPAALGRPARWELIFHRERDREGDLEYLLQQLYGARAVAASLLAQDPAPRSSGGVQTWPRELFRRKLDAAIEEIEARQRRLKIQVVGAKPKPKRRRMA